MTVYYVATNGSNNNNGSSGSPWKTISYAVAQNLRAGDEVVVRDGTYNEAVSITKSGSAAGYITVRAENPGEALIRPPAGYGYSVNVGANYVVVEGFDIKGPTVEGHGVQVNNTHHVKILNNSVHDSGASGIQFNWSDFITIEGNETYNNARLGWFSGISIYENRAVGGTGDTSEFRTIVRNNISYDNFQQTGLYTDGNGIIIDDFQNSHTGGAYPSYAYRTLVEGNVTYDNGGKGIAVHWSNNVTARNNTAYHNNTDNKNTATWRGEFSQQDSSNNVWVNNIAVADTSTNQYNTAIGFYGNNSNTTWLNNLTYNGTPGQASINVQGGNSISSTANRLGVNPQFVDPANGDFHLRAGSPAIDAGTGAYGLAGTDNDGHDRTIGTVDIGAYEHDSGGGGGTNTAPTITTAATLSIDENRTAVTTVAATDPNGDVLTFAISGGADAARFRIDASSGALSFVAAPNYEAPADAGANNVYNVSVSASDGVNAAVSKALAISVNNVAEGGGDTTSFFSSSARPAITKTSDPADYELGMRFRATSDGEISALRYYRGTADAGDTDTRTMTLWSSNGTKLGWATVTSSAGADGWQVADLSSPIDITAGQTYTVSYTTTRNYAFSESYFTSQRTSADGELVALANGGVFNNTPGRMPGQTWHSSNYWADVVFDPEDNASAAELGTTILGTAAADTLTGGAGDDVIQGLGGRDLIIGAGGADTVSGGNGDDVFVYRDASESTAGDRDVIQGFSRLNDTLDVSRIDAVDGGGDNAFTWRGASVFTEKAGELRYQSTSSGLTIQGDTDGDGVADFQVALTASYGSFFGQDVIL